jgi:hypothetical protein
MEEVLMQSSRFLSPSMTKTSRRDVRREASDSVDEEKENLLPYRGRFAAKQSLHSTGLSATGLKGT